MRKTKAHEIAKILADRGVRHVIGIPGTHNIEFWDALLDHPEITSVLITDEQSGGFIADGYARSSGKLAVLSLVPGAGLSHALSGIAEAYLDQVPMLVLASGIRRDTGKKFQLHDVDQLAMAQPVCKWSIRIRDWNRVEEIFDQAIRIATEAPRGPVVIELPAEGMLLSDPACQTQEALPEVVTKSKPLSHSEASSFFDRLASSEQIGLYVGNIALWGMDPKVAQKKLQALAKHLGALVWTTISAKGLYPETDERFVWNVLGAGAPKDFHQVEDQVDLWIALGGRFSEVATASYGFKPKAPLIHVDVDVNSLGANYEECLSLQKDAWNVVDFLLESPARKNGQGLGVLKKARDEYFCDPLPQANGKVSPQRLFKALQKVLPANTVYSVDSGNGLFLAMEHLKLEEPASFLAPVDYSCMGYSVPAAIGAKLADPDRTVVALPGDGAFLMTGLELLTAQQYRVAPLVLVLRDGELSQISQFQKGSVVRTTLTELPEYELSKIAAVVGFDFEAIDPQVNLENTLTRIWQKCQEGRPVLVEVPIDYSTKTAFTRGVVATNFKRFPLTDKGSLAARLVVRKFLHRTKFLE